jgi:phage terminase large subunit
MKIRNPYLGQINQMPLSQPQLNIADSEARFRVAVSGRRFGKTHIAIRELARHARHPNSVCWAVFPSYRQARQVVWDKLKRQLIELHWVQKINETDLRLELVNNSIIALRGADAPDSLRGVGLDFLVMDEVADIEETAFTEVLRPTLADKKGKALFLGTPKGKANWLFDLYQRGQDVNEPQWESWQYTTVEGGIVTQAEIEAAKNDLGEREFRQEFLASFEQWSGTIYYNFSRENVTVRNEPLPKNILLFVDFNVSPISGAVAVQTKTGIHIMDEIVIYGSNTDELVQEVKNRYPQHIITAFPDPAGVQRKSSAGGRTDITILQQAGFQVKYRTSHPPVRDRINAVNSLLLNAAGARRLTIDPKCKKVIECLEKQVYKEGTQVPDKTQNYDHMNDAIGYGCEFLYPIRRDIIPQPVTPWGIGTKSARTY